MNKRIIVSCLVLILVLTVSATTKNGSGLSPDKLSKIHLIIKTEMAKQKIPALSIAIATDNQLRYEQGFGLADLENKVPANAATAFRTASIAKAITAVGVLQLAEQGKLNLDAPIQKYCQAFPQKQWTVTARQLLGHLGGVRHYKPGEANGTKFFPSIASSLSIFKDDPLLLRPGQKYVYTTFGYSVLGCAIEGVSGARYEDYVTEHLFKPAEMKNTELDNHRLIIPHRARGYTKLSQQRYDRMSQEERLHMKVDEIYNASLHDTSMKVPGGGLLATPADLVRFAAAVNTKKLLDKNSLEQMWTEQKTRDGKTTGYGLGWDIAEIAGLKLVRHTGGQAGTSTLLEMVPEKGLVVAIMCNLDGVAVTPIADQINAVLLSTN